jgi:hypothetical protein
MVGCVTLTMACVLMGVWLRSRFFRDSLNFPIGSRQYCVFSMASAIGWSGLDHSNGGVLEWESEPIAHSEVDSELSALLLNAQMDFLDQRLAIWLVSYWLLVLPLTLLSAYLILWKPRKREVSESPGEFGNSN